MRLKHLSKRLLPALFSVVILATYPGCATTQSTSVTPQQQKLKEARGKQLALEERAGAYLEVAAEAAKHLGTENKATASREEYNTACAELVVLLRDSQGGRLWNKPLTLTHGGAQYRLQFQAGNKSGVWDPGYFTEFLLAKGAPLKTIQKADVVEGSGGTLIGVRKKTPREAFTVPRGVSAPVTATLDFKGGNATLALHDPGKDPTARFEGRTRTLAANYSAPLGYYRQLNETIVGLMGAISVNRYMSDTGIYMLEPYDPQRIPVIFVHGLISTPLMWRNVINEVDRDPELRKRYQVWVFGYPTGNPVAYSALRFRQDLAKAHQLYGLPHGVVLVAHSLGGLVSQMQTVTLTEDEWNKQAGGSSGSLFAKLPPDNLITKSIVFKANPDVQRVLFICTPHRGANMATQTIGQIAMRLISLPASLTGAITKTMRTTLTVISGGTRDPNGITSLSPKNPTLKVMDHVKIQAPCHTVLGDRGLNNSPNSSDGVVPYWSSHLDCALSEKIVPGPHSCCDFPQTIAEIKRVLHVHLNNNPK